MSDVGDRNKLPALREREAAIQRLSAAFAADVLPLEELERRLDAVYQAATRSELERLTADLPSAETAPTAPEPAGPPLAPQITAVFSSTERGGFVEVPVRLELRSVFGNVELDLRSARFQPGVTEIVVLAIFGNIEIELPSDTAVENHAGAIFGNIECDGPRAGVPGAAFPTTVRITGQCIFGNVEIEVAKRPRRDPRLPDGSHQRRLSS